MTDLVPADRIEKIVGMSRHPTDHLGRAVSAEQTVYILHSAECRDSGIDLRDCEYSTALDDGIDPDDFVGDMPVLLEITDGHLVGAPIDDMSDCPYYQGTGICESGCYSEPRCKTEEPIDGWPSQRAVPDAPVS